MTTAQNPVPVRVMTGFVLPACRAGDGAANSPGLRVGGLSQIAAAAAPPGRGEPSRGGSAVDPRHTTHGAQKLTEQPSLTKAEIAARIPACPDGWTAQDDLALMEGLFKLVGLMRIAVSIGKPFDLVQDRFLQLRNAASCGPIPFGLTAQSRLLEIVRDRAGADREGVA